MHRTCIIYSGQYCHLTIGWLSPGSRLWAPGSALIKYNWKKKKNVVNSNSSPRPMEDLFLIGRYVSILGVGPLFPALIPHSSCWADYRWIKSWSNKSPVDLILHNLLRVPLTIVTVGLYGGSCAFCRALPSLSRFIKTVNLRSVNRGRQIPVRCLNERQVSWWGFLLWQDFPRKLITYHTSIKGQIVPNGGTRSFPMCHLAIL